MNYFFSKTIRADFDEAIALVTGALKKESFGMVSEIRMHEKFKEKLGVDFKKYTILGFCNPAYAYEAVQVEEKIGTMLPCNVVIIQKENGLTEVAAINPVASMMAVENPKLEAFGKEVAATLERIIRLL
jgi:uncharacterized protein (DUF302 family)